MSINNTPHNRKDVKHVLRTAFKLVKSKQKAGWKKKDFAKALNDMFRNK